MARRWIYYLAALLGCLVFFVAYQGWLAWLLLCCLFWLPLASLVLSLPAMLTASMVCRCGGNLLREETEIIRVDVRCPLPLPPHRCCVTVERPLTGQCWVIQPGQGLPTDHVGGLYCRLKGCRVYDYLGLFFIGVRRRRDATVTVRPREVALPAPGDLQRYLSRAWKPKPGGGFAENHELRLYRPGDNLNQVHWKLTAKTGKLVIREPVEPLGGRVMLTMDLKGEPEVLDVRFGQLLWMGKHLLKQGFGYEICVLTGDGVAAKSIGCEEDLYRQLDVLLGCRPAQDGSVQEEELCAGWRYHIGGGADEA